MEEHKQQIIEGTTLFGLKRRYTLDLMLVEVGQKLFHSYASVMVNFIPEIIKALPNLKDLIGTTFEGQNDTVKIVLNDDLIELIRLIPTIFTWERIEELAKEMLAGAKVEIDGEIMTIGENGMGAYMLGDPMELYTAIFYGIMANYSPLLASLTSEDDDLTPVSGKK